MAVPEAAMNEENGVVFCKNDVGLSGEGFVFRSGDGEPVAIHPKTASIPGMVFTPGGSLHN